MGGQHFSNYYCWAVLLVIFSATEKSYTSDEGKNDKKIEVNPWLLYDGDYMSKQTGSVGDNIIIGSYSPPLDPIPDEYVEKFVVTSRTTDYLCRKDITKFPYLKDFETEIRKRTLTTLRVGLPSDESLETKSATDYFIYLAQEVWECTDRRLMGPPFYRVRNELFSIQDIKKIHHVDGVSVSVVRYHVTFGERVRIEEIKYFLKKEDGTLSRFSKPLRSDHYHLAIDEVASPIPGLTKEFQALPAEKYKDKTNLEMEDFEIFESGQTLKIGSSWERNAGERQYTNDVIRCEPYQYINRAQFRPEVFKVNVVGQTRRIYSKLSDEQFEESFTIVERKVWTCYFVAAQAMIGNPGFYRVEHEIIGKKPIEKVSFFPRDIISAFAITVPGGESLRYTEVEHFYIKTWKRVDFNVNRVERTEQPLYRIRLQQHGAKFITEVKYVLAPSVVYRTLISDDGYDLRIGYWRSSQTFGKDREHWICVNELRNTYDTPVTMMINNNEVLYSMESIDASRREKYFKYKKRQFYVCTTQIPDDNRKIYRMVNTLLFKVPIRVIETLDGTEIFHTKLFGDSEEEDSYLEVTETKYILPTLQMSVKFVGIVELSGEPDVELTHITAMRMVRKTDDEIFAWFGDRPKTMPCFKECKDSDRSPIAESEVIVGKGTDTMVFNYVSSQTSGADTEFVCDLTPDSKAKPLALFTIQNSANSEVDRMASYARTDTNSKYFEDPMYEFWTCRLSQNSKQILQKRGRVNDLEKGLLRVVTKQILKKLAPNDIGIIKLTRMDRVSFETVNDQYRYATKIENVRYYKIASDTLQLVNLEGYRVLEKKPKLQETWQSGTKKLLNDYEIPKTVLSTSNLQKEWFSTYINNERIVSLMRRLRKLVEPGMLKRMRSAVCNSANKHRQPPVLPDVTYIPEEASNLKVLGSGYCLLRVKGEQPSRIIRPTTSNGYAKCLQDKSNPESPYMPKVLEYVDDKIYELDYQELHIRFAIKTSIWICDDLQNQFIRVTQKLNGMVPISAVIYSGSVEVEGRSLDNNIERSYYTADIFVNTLIDVVTKEIIEYDGKTVEVE